MAGVMPLVAFPAVSKVTIAALNLNAEISTFPFLVVAVHGFKVEVSEKLNVAATRPRGRF